MDLKDGIIGIDKLKLRNIPISINDITKLYHRGNVTINENSLYKRLMLINGNLKEIGDIVINDDLFRLTIGVKKVGISRLTYESLEINPANILYNCNVNNVSSVEEFIKALKIISTKIKEYGIEADIFESKISEIEINTNLILEDTFTEYRNVFELIQSVLPKTYKQISNYVDNQNDKYTGFKTGNSELNLKFYDKTSECGIEILDNLLRIEYRLLKSEKIQSLFNYTDIKSLINKYNDVEIVFKKLIEKNIVDKIEKKLKELVNKNIAILKEAQVRDRYYVKHYLAIAQDSIIFDYAIGCKAINKLNITTSNKYKRKRELKKFLKERQGNGRNIFFNNVDRIYEILKKLGYQNIILDYLSKDTE